MILMMTSFAVLVEARELRGEIRKKFDLPVLISREYLSVGTLSWQV